MANQLARQALWAAFFLLISAQDESACRASLFNISLFDHEATVLSTAFHGNDTYEFAGLSNNVPFCAVNASIAYGKYDSLLFSVWLPHGSDFTGRFMAVGNGGMAGSIDYAGMLTQLNSGMGFAVAGGNAGHLATDNNGGLGQPGLYLPYLHDKNQVKAWIHDAVSLFVPVAKAMTAAFYKTEARHAYYVGCSTGGAQGFALAQFHPDLFDGIIAGSPGIWYSHLILSFLWNAQHIEASFGGLSQDALSALTNASVQACDGNDGLYDGLIENPLACRFDVESLACSDTTSNNTTCLNKDQIMAARAIFAGPSRPCGRQIYPGFLFGSETGWSAQVAVAQLFTIPILQNLVYDNLTYDANTFDWDSDVDKVDMRAGKLIDEKNPSLLAYRLRGNKMLVTQGWPDPLNAAEWPIEYLERLRKDSSGDIGDFFRLFMVPGGGHCGSSGQYPFLPAMHHTVPKLVEWVEKGHRPKCVVSTNPQIGNRTRKLCPWPKVAEYVTGDPNSWRSYVCGRKATRLDSRVSAPTAS